MLYTGLMFLGLGALMFVFGYRIRVKKRYDIVNDFDKRKKPGVSDEDHAKRIGRREMLGGGAMIIAGAFILLGKFLNI